MYMYMYMYIYTYVCISIRMYVYVYPSDVGDFSRPVLPVFVKRIYIHTHTHTQAHTHTHTSDIGDIGRLACVHEPDLVSLGHPALYIGPYVKRKQHP